MTQYLNADAFTRLFHRRHVNHAQICLNLQQLAAGVARCFWFHTADDREEVESAALLYAIERVDRFRYRRGANAFAYYTSLIHRNILRQIEQRKRLKSRAGLFADVEPRRESDGRRESNTIEASTPYAQLS